MLKRYKQTLEAKYFNVVMHFLRPPQDKHPEQLTNIIKGRGFKTPCSEYVQCRYLLSLNTFLNNQLALNKRLREQREELEILPNLYLYAFFQSLLEDVLVFKTEESRRYRNNSFDLSPQSHTPEPT